MNMIAMTAPKKFQRRTEDFTCAHCGALVTGNGYTNHCPQCLYSRHVDINPGDRAAACGGLMQPIEIQNKGDAWIILHHCQACGFERRCKTQPEDIDALLKLAAKLTDLKMK